ncbi:hypothetical protein ULF88_16630 [Halopseudomonas pachastrellae]|nr:hypothetical protein [Halopseudomonas pachastrellae]
MNQHLIARRMAVFIVDALEMVKVAVDESHCRASRSARLQRAVNMARNP